jgi:hypothetical protein
MWPLSILSFSDVRLLGGLKNVFGFGREGAANGFAKRQVRCGEEQNGQDLYDPHTAHETPPSARMAGPFEATLFSHGVA